MNRMRIAIFVALVLALVLPFSVQAAGVYYCGVYTNITAGNGTYANPWACPDQASLNRIIYDVICPAGGGWLYQIQNGAYVYYRIEWVRNQCSITFQQRYNGYPPNTGPTLPMPLLVGGVAGAGALLIVGGVFLRRRTMSR